MAPVDVGDAAQRLEGPPATLTTKVRAIGSQSMADDIHLADPLGLLKRDFDGLDQAMAIVGSQHEAIQHHLKAGLASFRECDLVVKVQDLVTAPQSGEPSLDQGVEQ